MSYPLYPLTAYTYFDPSVNNFLPVTNSTFVYGTLGPTQNVLISGTYYTCSNLNLGSLDVSNVFQGNQNLIQLVPSFIDSNNIQRNTIQASQSGIYRIKTTLSFTSSTFVNPTPISFWFSTAPYTNTALNSNNIIRINITTNPTMPLTTNQLLSFGYLYANSSSGINIFNPTATSGGYVPYFSINSGATTTALTNNGLSVVEEIFYLQAGSPLYFNIQCAGNNSINATGNFELELLYAIPNTSNPQNIKSLSNYTYTNANIEYPITNTNFLYGTLGPSPWITGSAGNTYTAYNTNYGSLTVTSLYGNAGLTSTQTVPNNTNAGLARLITMTNSGFTGYSLSIIQSGIYRLRTTLSFSGSGFGSGVQLLALVLTRSPLYNVALSTQLPINYSKPTSITTSEYLSLGYLFSGSTSSSSTRPYYEIDTTSGITYPTIFLENTPISGSTFTNNGISVAEVILYLYGNPTTNSGGGTTTLFFNISPSGGSNYLNATGNFILELLCAT